MLRGSDIPTSKAYRILIYGPQKVGKTRLACAYPESWGRGVYVAIDPGGELMSSVIPEHRERLEVVKPNPKASALREASTIATYDWKAEGFGVIILDTMTVLAQDLLAEYAKKMRYGTTAVMGTKGEPDYHVHPAPGDFGDAQNSVLHVLKGLFKQPMHVIVVCWQGWVEPKEGGAIVGGPSTVGSAQIAQLDGLFQSVIRLEPNKDKETGKPIIVARNSAHGIWKAGTRVADQPIPNIKLDVNPRNMWDEWEKYV